MSAVPYTPDDGLTPLQRAFQAPAQPLPMRQGTTTVAPPMTISPEPTPELSGPQQDAQGKWVPGYTNTPGKPTDINPTVNQYDKDIRWQDEPGGNQKAPQPGAPRTVKADYEPGKDWLADKIHNYVQEQDLAGAAAPQKPVHVAQSDAEKESHLQALRSLFGLTPDAPAPEKPVDIQPSAMAHPDSPEFKAWLRSSSPEEFQKWMESGQAAAVPPSPTDVAVARARAAIPPPAPAAPAAPSQPPLGPTEQAAVNDARKYQAALGGTMSPVEQAEMLKALAAKYAKKESDEKFDKQLAHAKERAVQLGGYNNAMTPMEQAAAINDWAAKHKPAPRDLGERVSAALPFGSLENFQNNRRAIENLGHQAPLATARTGVGAAVQPTMLNDFVGRGFTVDPRTGEFDTGPKAPIESPEAFAERVVAWKKNYEAEQRAAREKAFAEALAASGGK